MASLISTSSSVAGDNSSIGLMLTRKLEKDDGRIRLQVLMLENTKRRRLVIPKGKIEAGLQNKLIAAQNVVRDQLGFSSKDYEIHQDLGFRVQGKNKESYYWLASMNDGDLVPSLNYGYSHYHWLDFSAIKNKALVHAGRIKQGLGTGMAEFMNQYGAEIAKRVEQDQD